VRINEIIKDLLILNDSLVIEGFGIFETKYQPAQKNEIDGTMLPPTKSVSFNQKIKTDDSKILFKYLVEKGGLTEQDAQKQIEDFVSATDAKVKMKGEVEIKDLGIFYSDGNSNIAFKQIVTESLLLENYGMSNVTIPSEIEKNPIVSTVNTKKTKTITTTTTTTTVKPEPEKKKGKTLVRILIAVPIIVLLVLLIIFNAKVVNWGENLYSNYVDKKQNKKNELADNKVNKDNKKDSLKNENTVKIDTTKTVKDTTNQVVNKDNKTDEQLLKEEKNIEVNTEALGTTYKNYYLIVGSFNNEKNASKLVNTLTNKGFTSEIIKNNPTKFRVSVGGFETVEEAIKQYKAYVEKSNSKDIWLLRNK